MGVSRWLAKELVAPYCGEGIRQIHKEQAQAEVLLVRPGSELGHTQLDEVSANALAVGHLGVVHIDCECKAIQQHSCSELVALQ
eukprot:6464907-Amphidinium_carterae.1